MFNRRRHRTNAHPQPFRCIFTNYDCMATFGSKNEWKRHINRLHLRLAFWRCDLGGCRMDGPRQQKKQDEHKDTRSNDFNRKDLFTQHLRRIHCPTGIKQNAPELSRWNATLSEIHSRCYIEARDPPGWGRCVFCGRCFEGEGGWDDCLEHMGKYFERLDADRHVWTDDVQLRAWMAEHGLLQQNRQGRWTLTFEGKQRRGSKRPLDDTDLDADAEGEGQEDIVYPRA